jgi:hypothetical protein
MLRGIYYLLGEMIAENMITVRLTPPFRHVRMYQSHPAQVTPSWYGDSVGHYEGYTLVIDTVGPALFARDPHT